MFQGSHEENGPWAYVPTIVMKKSVNWLKSAEDEMLNQFNVFTMKLLGYAIKYGLSAAQTTAIRNDYLWLAYAITCTRQFQQEARNRAMWKNHLKDGPQTGAAATVPGLGSEFSSPAPPAVPDGILIRWRLFVAYLKNHMNYEVADGVDLGIEATETPAQSMKPTAALTIENGHVVRLSVFKDGHAAIIVWCQRNGDAQPVRLGVFNRATVLDERPNVNPTSPEWRDYTLQYQDDDQPVGQLSDVLRVVTTGVLAA